MMTEQLFLKKAKQAIKMCDDELSDRPHDASLLQCVWMCHILGYKKALFFNVSRTSGEYFEVTYDREKDAFYVDKYVKKYNNAVDADSVKV